MITIGIVDDIMINRKTVKRSLEEQPGFAVVLEAVNGSDCIDKMLLLPTERQPQLILMDIDMPVMNGIEAIAISTVRFPQTKFLVLTVFNDDEKIFEAIQAGAIGYLLKDDDAIRLSEAIREAMEFDGSPMSPAIARKTLHWLKAGARPEIFSAQALPADPITAREIDIVKLMVQGRNFRGIADQLHISPHTVRAHIKKIYEKLHINSKAQAIQLAYKYKWVK